MIRKATLVLVAAIGIASPALAQSYDPDMGTGNLVAINNGAHIAAPQNGRNAYGMVPRDHETTAPGGSSRGYEEMLNTH
jgi:hypothetical protein